ncbi:MAG: GNAT family N-acetyltransferase [Bdellovibrionales bacterium]|nr:GNAT family N-acetyltransferase [Bdellovibrionales bacterium]
MEQTNVTVREAAADDAPQYAEAVAALIRESAQHHNIHPRNVEDIRRWMTEGVAVIALDEDGIVIGFCYYHLWSDRMVTHSALVVRPDRRRQGIGRQMKDQLHVMVERDVPGAVEISRTTCPVVVHMNERIGLQQCPLSDLTSDPAFWHECEHGCRDYALVNAPGSDVGQPNPIGTRCCCTGLIRRQ